MENRNYSLDIIKIVATVVILLHHYQQVFNVRFDKGINYYGGSFSFGWFVELFFVISGFVIAKYEDPIKNYRISFRQFFLKRYLRFFPLLPMSCILFEFVAGTYNNIADSAFLKMNVDLFGTMIASLGIQAGWFFKNPFINNPIWYISVLFVCYIFFYFLVKLSKKSNINVKILYLIVIISGIIININDINLPFFNQYTSRGYYSFFTGVILYSFVANKKIKLFEIFVLFMVTLFISLYLEKKLIKTYHVYFLSLVVYPFVVVVCNSDIIKKRTSKPFYGTLSEIAFNAYIWHIVFYSIFEIINVKMQINYDFNNRLNMVWVVVLCFGFGTISYFLIEKPFRKIKTKITSKFNEKLF